MVPRYGSAVTRLTLGLSFTKRTFRVFVTFWVRPHSLDTFLDSLLIDRRYTCFGLLALDVTHI